MNNTAFFDTNILVYLFDRREDHKRAIAAEVWGRCAIEKRGVLSTQVLQEFFVTITQKAAQLTGPEAQAVIIEFLQLEVVTVTPLLILEAIDVRERYRLSFWDGLILAAAKSAGASLVYSEDFAHGQVYDGVRVENPFLAAAG